MSGDDILITGSPRSGTTLTCHLLNKLPDTVALHEPMQMRPLTNLATDAERVAAVVAFCAEQRRMALAEGRAVSKHVDGKVPDNPIASERSGAGARERLVRRGHVVIDKPLSPTFALAVKHPSGFAAMIDVLAPRFPMFAVVRNPMATLGSWSSVPFQVQVGHAGVGESLDPALANRLAGIADVLDRQIALLDWYHGRFVAALPPARIIRYEEIVRTGGRCLDVILPAAGELDEPLVERNLTQLYDRDHLLRIGERLLGTDGSFWVTYRRDDVERLLAGLEAGPPGEPVPAVGTVNAAS